MMQRGLLVALLALLAVSGAWAEDAVEISVQEASISVVESGGRVSTEVTLSHPARAGKRLRLDHTQTLKLAFKVAAQSGGDLVRPQQAFLRLTSVPSGAAAYFAALKTKEGGLAVSATSAAVQKQIGLQGGEYAAALVLGGTNVASPVEWEVASLDLLHPPQDDGTQPANEPLHATDALFTSRKEITHAHRAPERRAPVAVSLLFTAATLAPLAALLVVLVQLGANAKGLPSSGPGALAALGFHGGVASILGLLLLFWLRLNLMQLLPWLGALGAFTAACGSVALKSAAATRQKQE